MENVLAGSFQMKRLVFAGYVLQGGQVQIDVSKLEARNAWIGSEPRGTTAPLVCKHLWTAMRIASPIYASSVSHMKTLSDEDSFKMKTPMQAKLSSAQLSSEKKTAKHSSWQT
ncbi:uncharacterized protein MYCFIDRAFT_84736 [Pseudocercospora fijiensis CIRAD86]|uniref:Uncharacterized protein n=1 Tax=Pseudocercospora fijiensis (strain CIRAD86) TaxID=383855 RepID=M2ZD65_PSEFD|nr:uncharacterized protein MYCFIDRAFT_84736 [Pseudocercospora fijiensis CIRAD86]EME77064.1 hypothetical protein MYCFIDRAFT_84736 [Pseudocercospora fijiensis CIRAD86]